MLSTVERSFVNRRAGADNDSVHRISGADLLVVLRLLG